MKRKSLILILLIFVSCNDLNPSRAVEMDVSNSITKGESIASKFDFMPTSTTNAVVKREGYSFSYAEDFEQSEWVAYSLQSSDFKYANYERPFFEQDLLVKTNSADWRNYKNSGYDKGHLCPAGDRKASFTSYKETFFTSNISPQRHDFNSGVWNRLEEKTRYWAEKYNGIYVITGGILSDNLKTIGKEEVAVPNYFYKVLLTQDCKRMIGFLVPHKNSNKPLYEFVISVDAIEKMTGIDFFPNLSDSNESVLEKNAEYKNWSF